MYIGVYAMETLGTLNVQVANNRKSFNPADERPGIPRYFLYIMYIYIYMAFILNIYLYIIAIHTYILHVFNNGVYCVLRCGICGARNVLADCMHVGGVKVGRKHKLEKDTKMHT